MSRAIVEKKSGISPIWILPLVAICVGGWLLYKSHMDKGVDIVIRIENAGGITADKTPVVFKGTHVGMVKEIMIDKDLEHVNLTVEMKKEAGSYLVEDVKFWVEKVDVEAGRITGLDTLLSGSYIGLELGVSKKPARSFVALPRRPPVRDDKPGLHVTLHADALRSVQVGSGIFHKNVRLGSVQSYKLEIDDSVTVRVFIEPEFAPLVKESSRFWNASGITMSGGITDLKVHIASIAAIIRGGIQVETPTYLNESPVAQNGHEFTLFEDFEMAEYGIPLKLELYSGESIREGSTKIVYRGMDLGHVQKISINKNKLHTVTAEISLDPRAAEILNSGTKFYLVKPEFSVKGVRNLDTIINGAHITFIPGEGEPQDEFVVQGERPDNTFALEHHDGLPIKLKMADLGSISVGSPILYKKVVVGEITDVVLATEEDNVFVSGLIMKQYASLVKDSSRFFNMSGVEVTASLGSGVKIQTGTLETLVAGGIGFYNPTEGTPAEPSSQYPLYKDFAAADHRDGVSDFARQHADGLSLRLKAENLGAVTVGSPILYKKVMVGEITKISLREKEDDVLLSGVVMKKYAGLVKQTSRFYDISGVEVTASLGSGVKIQTGTLETLIAGGVTFYNPIKKGKAAKQKSQYQLYDDFDAAVNSDRQKIVIHFNDTEGFKKEGVRVKYNGIIIGQVTEVAYENKMTQIRTVAMVDKDAVDLMRSETKFWLVRPEFSLSGLQHLDTLVTGPYIDMEPGGGNLATEFTAVSEIEAKTAAEKGLAVILESQDLFSLKVGAPIYYRRVQVGEVIDFEFSPTFQKVYMTAVIYEPYTAIIRAGTKFWNASGIHVSGGVISGFKVSTESLDSLLTGGIALATPDTDEMGGRVSAGHHFTLFEEAEDSWAKWSPVLSKASPKPSDSLPVTDWVNPDLPKK
jgi:paraquat-inducible protein B